MTADETSAYASNPDIEILSNTAQISAVKDKSTGMTGVVFWEAGTFDGITVDEPMIIMYKRAEDVLSIVASDPTHKLNSATIKTDDYVSLENSDYRMELLEDGKGIEVIFDSSNGESISGNMREASGPPPKKDEASTGSNTSNSGGGGGGNKKPVEENPEDGKVNESTGSKPAISFNDLAGFDWAKDYVETLTEKGIISGRGDGTFAPGDNVNRAEYSSKIDTTAKMYVDSVWFSDYNMSAYSPDVVGVVDGGTISSANSGVGFKFNGVLPLNSAPGAYNSYIEVKKNNEVINTGYTVQVEGDIIYVTGLKPSSNYTVTYNGGDKSTAYVETASKSVTFSTSAAHYDLTASHTDDTHTTIDNLPDSGKVLVKARLTNATAKATSARIIAVICDKTSDAFENVVMGEPVTVGIGKSANLSVTVNLPSYEGKKIKTFVWEDGTLKPYGTFSEITQ